MADEYIESIGFVRCEYGCGGWVHPNPSDPSASQAVWNHICLPKMKVMLEKWAAVSGKGEVRGDGR